jgi:cytochrome c55X
MPDARAATAALLGALLAAPAGAGEASASARPESARPESARPESARLERLVRQDCGSCHGLTLAGGLGPDLRPAALVGHDAESLAGIVLDGLPGTAMPPWRPLLTEAEALWIGAYLLKGQAP